MTTQNHNLIVSASASTSATLTAPPNTIPGAYIQIVQSAGTLSAIVSISLNNGLDWKAIGTAGASTVMECMWSATAIQGPQLESQ